VGPRETARVGVPRADPTVLRPPLMMQVGGRSTGQGEWHRSAQCSCLGFRSLCLGIRGLQSLDDVPQYLLHHMASSQYQLRFDEDVSVVDFEPGILLGPLCPKSLLYVPFNIDTSPLACAIADRTSLNIRMNSSDPGALNRGTFSTSR
jgi:hypothetical protein